MDFNNLFALFNTGNTIDLLFKIGVILFAVIYLLYTIVIGRQVTIMNRTLEDSFNKVVSLISTVQITTAFILLIFAVFFA